MKVSTTASNGQTALKAYNRPFKPVAGQKYIALIIGGLGLNVNITQRAIDDLPPEISLSFAAQTTDLQTWINKARAKGHEVLIELPMADDESTLVSLRTQRLMQGQHAALSAASLVCNMNQSNF